MIVRCLYASRAVSGPAESALQSILQQSRKNNPKSGITGMLCHANGIYVQLIEGGRTEVNKLLTTIMRDERNTGLEILLYEEITERRFGNWSMGQVNVANINSALLLKYSEKAELNPFACSGAATMSLLLEIAASGAIANR